MTRRLLLLVPALAARIALPGAAHAQSVAAGASYPPQDPAAVRQVAQDYLLQQLASLPGPPDIKVDEVHTERLPACDALSAFINGTLRPRSRMSVGIRCTAPKPWTLYVQATVSVPGEYYVAARPINAGQVLRRDDLAPRQGDLVNLPRGAITDPETVIGMSARNRIAMGQAIRVNNLRSAGSIRRGQTVRIMARGAGFVVTNEGEAMQDASPGSMVEVKTASGQIVSGILQPQGYVEVPM
jgi:flagella basal body P-ring formation protein FlgA